MFLVDLFVNLYLCCEEFCIVFMCVPIILLFALLYPMPQHKSKKCRRYKRVKNVNSSKFISINNKRNNRYYSINK